jgi:hypothetical protein
MSELTSSAEQPAPQRIRKFNPWWLGLLLLILVAGWIAYPQVSALFSSQDPVQETVAFEEETGIHISRVVLLAAGGMIDVHYQVLNPDKALVIHDTDEPPVLINETNGRRVEFRIPAHTGQTPLETGRGYDLMFPNEANAVKRGDIVTIQIGNVRHPHIEVQ